MLRVMMTVDAVGGVWRYAVDLAHALQRVGAECLLVGLGPAPSEIQRRECDARGIALTWTDEPLDWMEEEAALDGTGDALVALAREWGADVLHLNAASQAAGMPCALPVVVTSHSCVATWWAAVKGTPLPPGWRWQQALTARGLARADAVMVPTASHGRAIADVYGTGVRRHIVANATDDAEASGERRACVLAAGRWWDAAKNVRTLDAAAAVS
ncbi:MAG TPA: glycosyltransferase family 4 protein, partial [Acetobacteraceae bacterium]|nr:glycosyltransferase family 4 protein [Acetobacteraceae bacterium]